jgi:transposase
MPKLQSKLQLSQQELTRLREILHKGKHASRTLYRARILLLLHEGKSKTAIAEELDLGRSTVQRTGRSYRKNGLEAALFELPRSGRPKVVDEKTKAFIVATACSETPNGREHWTIEMLQKHVKQKKKKTISRMSLWRTLNEQGIKPWLEKNVVRAEGHSGIR